MARKKKQDNVETDTLTLILEALKRIESRLVSVSSPIIQHPYLSMQKLPPQEYKRVR